MVDIKVVGHLKSERRTHWVRQHRVWAWGGPSKVRTPHALQTDIALKRPTYSALKRPTYSALKRPTYIALKQPTYIAVTGPTLVILHKVGTSSCSWEV